MPQLSIVMPYYRNPGMLARHYQEWSSSWADGFKKLVEVVIVDDGSPEPAAEVRRPFNLPEVQIWRVKENRPWHQHAARNIGAHVARGAVLMMTDMDHVIPEDVLAVMLTHSNHHTALTFGRVDAPADRPWTSQDWPSMAETKRPDGSLKPHVNSFCLTRSAYWRVGGYDEEYCGHYGTDGLFRRRLWRKLRPVHWPNQPLIRVDRSVIADASTTDWPRKEGRAAYFRRKIAREKAARGDADVIKTLKSPYEQVL